MTQPTDKVREAFEAWWKASHQTPCENRFGAVRDGWDAWQASNAALNEQSAEIEPLKADIDRALYALTESETKNDTLKAEMERLKYELSQVTRHEP